MGRSRRGFNLAETRIARNEDVESAEVESCYVARDDKLGAVHRTPMDLQRALSSIAATKAAWKDLPPLARNEWTCWVTSAKLAETRRRRIERALSELKDGKGRPCCWPGCPIVDPRRRNDFDCCLYYVTWSRGARAGGFAALGIGDLEQVRWPRRPGVDVGNQRFEILVGDRKAARWLGGV